MQVRPDLARGAGGRGGREGAGGAELLPLPRYAAQRVSEVRGRMFRAAAGKEGQSLRFFAVLWGGHVEAGLGGVLVGHLESVGRS